MTFLTLKFSRGESATLSWKYPYHLRTCNAYMRMMSAHHLKTALGTSFRGTECCSKSSPFCHSSPIGAGCDRLCSWPTSRLWMLGLEVACWQQTRNTAARLPPREPGSRQQRIQQHISASAASGTSHPREPAEHDNRSGSAKLVSWVAIPAIRPYAFFQDPLFQTGLAEDFQSNF